MAAYVKKVMDFVTFKTIGFLSVEKTATYE